MKSLKATGNNLSISSNQIEVLNNVVSKDRLAFSEKLKTISLFPLRPTTINIFQINLGKMCNQVCKHCHVDAGPDRKEIMTKEIMQDCLNVIKENPELQIVDLTGGAPELNPNFRWFVEEISGLGKQIIVRCNLTIILANKNYNDLPEFYKKHKIKVVSSLPFFTEDRTDRQRGKGVFDQSIKALQMLNRVGYGHEQSDLILDLVYNPAGAFLPPEQTSLEKEFKQELKKNYDIVFNNLFVITNMPISRYLQYLLDTNNFEKYIDKLVQAFNPNAAHNVMCRDTISIGWDGYLYDCDFNQMLDLKVSCVDSDHLKKFNYTSLKNREIQLNQHCYGCTAGSGSSCGGQTA